MKNFYLFLCLLLSIPCQGQTTRSGLESPVQQKGQLYVVTSPLNSKGEVASATLHLKGNAVSGNKLKTTFHVRMQEGGSYFFLANTLSTYVDGKHFQPISVYVNGNYQGLLHNTQGDWEIIGITNQPAVFLETGFNTIEFVTDAPFYPEIDAIQLTKDRSALITSNILYQKYKYQGNLKSTVFSASNTEKQSWEVEPKPVSIVGNTQATAYQDVPVTYTYHRKISVTNTEKMEFHTTPNGSDDYFTVNTFMHLYKVGDSNHNSWWNDDAEDKAVSFHSKIEATLSPGDYYLVVRAKSNGFASLATPRAGLVNVYCNGSLLNEGVPVAGYVMKAPVNSAGTYNFFTSKTADFVRLFLMNEDKMMFNTEPYTYYPPADYCWTEGARSKVNFNKAAPNWKVLVTATSAWWMCFGHCDFYGGLNDAPDKYMAKFSNLKSGDAILMANDDSRYNSAAWAGGITNRNIWIGNSSKGSPYVWTSWDDYFGNKPARYANAPTYTRVSGGTKMVLAYSKDGTMAGISHFAVTNGANNQLHGFDCESKIGSWGRTTHTPNSLICSEYGKPYLYYYLETKFTPVPSPKVQQADYTLYNSICDGLTIEKTVDLDIEQKEKVNKMESVETGQFQQLYQKWESSLLLEDNILDSYAFPVKGKDYETLVNFGKKHFGAVLSIFCQKMFVPKDDTSLEQELSSILFCDIAASEYGEIMDGIKKEWYEHQYTEDGVYISPSVRYFTKLYMKEIIKKINEADVQKCPQRQQDICDNSELFSVSSCVVQNENVTFSLSLPKVANVSLKVVNMRGGEIVLQKDKRLNVGRYTFDIDSNRLEKGLNICMLTIDGENFTRKMIKK